MSKTHWTIADLQKLYHLYADISRYLLLKDEKAGTIPHSQRIQHGQAKVRTWTTNQLPTIGNKYGFLGRPDKQVVISIFVQNVAFSRQQQHII